MKLENRSIYIHSTFARRTYVPHSVRANILLVRREAVTRHQKKTSIDNSTTPSPPCTRNMNPQSLQMNFESYFAHQKFPPKKKTSGHFDQRTPFCIISQHPSVGRLRHRTCRSSSQAMKPKPWLQGLCSP